MREKRATFAIVFVFALSVSAKEAAREAPVKNKNIKKVQIQGKYYTYRADNIYIVKGKRVFFKVGDPNGSRAIEKAPTLYSPQKPKDLEKGQPVTNSQELRATISSNQEAPAYIPAQPSRFLPPVRPVKDNLKTEESDSPTDGQDGNDNGDSN